MTPSRRPRTKLSDSVHRQLNMYALAAGEAGVSLLALNQPSEAKIVYTRVHKFIGPNSTLGIDLNHDGVIDFVIHDAYRATLSSSLLASLRATAQGNNGIEGPATFIKNPAFALLRGAKIGPPKSFGGTVMQGFSAEGGNEGSWAGQPIVTSDCAFTTSPARRTTVGHGSR